jgi:hypothetical protein
MVEHFPYWQKQNKKNPQKWNLKSNKKESNFWDFFIFKKIFFDTKISRFVYLGAIDKPKI